MKFPPKESLVRTTKDSDERPCVQHIYRFKCGYGISLLVGWWYNPDFLEAIVICNVSEDGIKFNISTCNPVSNEVVRFGCKQEAIDFIDEARLVFNKLGDLDADSN